MPFTLRPSGPGPVLTRVSSSDSTTVSNASQAAVEASRAATLAWQGKKPNGGKPRNPSPTSSRAGSIDMSNVKRPSIPDTMSLLDAPLIDFSAPVLNASSAPLNQQDPFQAWAPLSPALYTLSSNINQSHALLHDGNLHIHRIEIRSGKRYCSWAHKTTEITVSKSSSLGICARFIRTC